MISVIVPVYNAESFIEKTIDSVLCQTFENVELVIINDGSTDDTFKICQSYGEINKCKKISVYSQKNSGCSASRNLGISMAKGEYLCFCDHDDILPVNTLSILACQLKGGEYDMVKGSFITKYDYKDSVYSRELKPHIYNNTCEVIDDYLNFRQSIDAVWNGLYRTDFIRKKNIRFDESMKYGGEDLNFTLKILENNPRVKLISDNVYEWVVHKNQSTTMKRSLEFVEDMNRNINLEFSIIKNCSEYVLKNVWKEIRDEYIEYLLDYGKNISNVDEKMIYEILSVQDWVKYSE